MPRTFQLSGTEVTISRDGHREATIALATITSVVAYKKDLFKPELINVLITGPDGEHELEEIAEADAALLTRMLRMAGPLVDEYPQWWQKVVHILHRQGDIPIFVRAAAD